MDQFEGKGTFLVPLGAGTGRVRWIAWTACRGVVGEAADETDARRDANETLAMLEAMATSGSN